MSINILYRYLLWVWLSISTMVIPFNGYTIMLDPAGDARHTGRAIGTSFERAITFQIAQALQQQLQQALPCTVIITRSPGEIVYPLQSANFANRLSLDLYISLHAYHAPQEKHTIALYIVSPSPTLTKKADLAMMPFRNAHEQSHAITKKYAHHMHTALQSSSAHQFQLPPAIALPFIPLEGIQAPALGIEINCISPDNVALYVEPLTKAIISTLTS